MLYPITADVLGIQDRSTLCFIVDTPVPVTTSVIDEMEALLANAMLEEAVPLICGENLIVNGTV